MANFEELFEVIRHLPQLSGKGCNVYTVKKPNSTISEFGQWITNHKGNPEFQLDFDSIISSITEISKLGCSRDMLRSENKASALPFTSKYRKRKGEPPLELPS